MHDFTLLFQVCLDMVHEMPEHVLDVLGCQLNKLFRADWSIELGQVCSLTRENCFCYFVDSLLYKFLLFLCYVA